MNNFSEYSSLFRVWMSGGNQMMNEVYGTRKCINLPQNKVYCLGIDQSTSQTGLFLKELTGEHRAECSTRNGISLVLDVKNKGLPNKEIYALMLKEFLANNFGETNLRFIAMEVPIAQSTTVYTRTVLTELKGVLNSWEYEIPSFRTAQVVSVEPPTWRKHFLKLPQYKGRRKAKDLVKQAAEEESLRLYPQFGPYADLYTSPPDSFDAIGILEGSMCEYFYRGHPGLLRANVFMKAAGSLNYECEMITIPKSDSCIEDWLSDYVDEEILEQRGYRIVVFNSKLKDLKKTLRGVAGSSNKVTALVFNAPKYDDIIKWNMQIEKSPSEAYVAFLYRRSESNKVDATDTFESFAEMYEIFDKDPDEGDYDEDDYDEGD